MGLSASQYVFNMQALVLGCLMLVTCVVIQATFVFLVVSKGKRSIKNLRRAENDFQAHGVFIACVLMLLSSHLIQIYVWGYALHAYDIIANQHQAMVYAGSTYTTVGFITDPLPTQWHLLSVIMATSGLFTFGWSTAVMFILSQALFPEEK